MLNSISSLRNQRRTNRTSHLFTLPVKHKLAAIVRAGDQISELAVPSSNFPYFSSSCRKRQITGVSGRDSQNPKRILVNGKHVLSALTAVLPSANLVRELFF